MSEETIADILAEMFDFSDKRIEEGRDHAMTSESVGLIVHQLAKRFEAAWTREREDLDKRISDLKAYAKLWTDRADELRLKCDEFYAKAKSVGNAAAHAMTLDEAIAHAEDVADRCDTSCGREHRQLADWLKELRDVKSQPVGNAAAMREALVQCELFLGNVSRHGHPTLNPGDKCTACDGVDELRGMVVRALSAPARNCDVGTAEEQGERQKEYCREYFTPDKLGGNCRKCPLKNRRGWSCQLAWAQMPYEQEGGAK